MIPSKGADLPLSARSLTLLHLDDELAALLDHPCASPALPLAAGVGC